MSFSISAQFRDLCLCLKLSGSFCWGLKSTVKETGETSRAISWQVERLLRWLVMLRSTLSGSIQEVKIRGDQASTTSPPLTSLKWNPLHLITTDLPHRVTLPRWLTHGSTQTWVAMATTLYSWNPPNGSLLSLYGPGAYDPVFQMDSTQFQWSQADAWKSLVLKACVNMMMKTWVNIFLGLDLWEDQWKEVGKLFRWSFSWFQLMMFQFCL